MRGALRTATQHKSYADTEAYYVRTAATHTRTRITSGLTPVDRVRTTATTTYTPTSTGPLTSTTVADAKSFKTTTALDFATGATLKVTDPNNKITESECDALGRVTKVWLPNHTKVLWPTTPNYTYAGFEAGEARVGQAAQQPHGGDLPAQRAPARGQGEGERDGGHHQCPFGVRGVRGVAARVHEGVPSNGCGGAAHAGGPTTGQELLMRSRVDSMELSWR